MPQAKRRTRRSARRRRPAYPGREAYVEASVAGADGDASCDVSILSDVELLAKYEGMLVKIVTGIKSQFQISGDYHDDMMSDARMGLLTARGRFDPAVGVAFSTFSYYRIKGAILDGLRKSGVIARRERAEYAMDKAATLLGEARCAEGSELSYDKVLARVDTTIKALGGAHLIIHDAMEEEAARNDSGPAKAVENAQRQDMLREAIAQLSDTEQELLVRIYYRGESLSEAGAAMGYSRSWSCRIHSRALEKVGDLLKVRAPDDFGVL